MKHISSAILLMMVINVVIAMEPVSPSLVEVFGFDKKYNNMHEDINKHVASHVTPHGWWYPEKKLYDARAFTIEKNVKKEAQFSPSGKKIVTSILQSNVHVWDTASGKLVSSCSVAGMAIIKIELNKQETKMFALDKYGRRFCFDIQHNKLLWIDKVLDLENSEMQLSDDGSALIIGYWRKNIVINAATGEQKKILWDHDNKQHNNTMCANFIKNTSQVIVLHNGFLQHENSEIVSYKSLLPPNTCCPFYNREKNRLIYFYNDKDEVGIVPLDTEAEKSMQYVRRKRAKQYIACVSESGSILLQYSWHCDKRGNFANDRCFIDLYDLETSNKIISIPCDLWPQGKLLNKQENLLLLDTRDGAQLWDIYKNCLICCFKYNARAHSVDINPQGDKIVIAKNDVMIWGHYKPTFKQLLLRQLLNWWWQVKRTPHKFASPDLLLADIARLFSPHVDKTQENPTLTQELIATWQSFAPQGRHLLFSPIQAAMWQTLQKRIERSGQYKDYDSSIVA